MYSMKPILEPDVISLLNNGRFKGDLQGYILSDGADLFGWSLFNVDGDTTHMLDINPPSDMFLDGLIRASVALGESQGAEKFTLNLEIENLKRYKDVFFKNEGEIIPNESLFKPCNH